MRYQITLAIPGRPVTTQSYDCGTYSIGRAEQMDLRIVDGLVSESHARLILTPDSAWVEDLRSSNGTTINGKPIFTPTKIEDNTIVGIGQSVFRVAPIQSAINTADAKPAPTNAPTPTPQSNTPTPPTPAPKQKAPAPTEDLNAAKHLAIKAKIKQQIHSHLVQRLDLKRMSATEASTDELEARVKETLSAIIKTIADNGKLPADISTQTLMDEIYNEAMRLGPIEQFLADETITEIMINGPDKVYVERNGKLTLSGQTFMDADSVLAIIERIVAPLGRRIDESQPYVDARLADGSRVNAIISPLSLIGPCITIRKFAKRVLTVQDFINYGTWSASAAEFLDVCVRLRKNIIVSGGTGSGKTTLLNLLSSFIPETDRILTIEDAAELRLNQPHVVRLESRPPNIEGKGAITIRDLVRNALRMRPDRIIVGECRGGETLDMLQAMNTGHDGSLTTVHANSPRDVISRMETMVLMSGMELPSRAIREQIASAVDIIVQESRMSDGSRKVVCISEIVGQEGTQIVMQDIFVFEQDGIDENGRITGKFKPTGAIPTFFDQLASRGIKLDTSIFDPNIPQPGGH